MFDEITGEKKVCINREVHNCIFTVLIFENIITLLAPGLMFEIWFLNLTEDDRNNVFEINIPSI